jgi:nitrate reductase (NAD(P)H)
MGARKEKETTKTITAKEAYEMIEMDKEELFDLVQRNGGDIAKIQKFDKECRRVNRQDINTPDCWIRRHDKLVRLTGQHPFNSEPELSSLEECGMITSSSLHFVRNHGAVPELRWDTHAITLAEDLNKKKNKIKTFKMDDIAKMPRVTKAVLLVCAGNRRKEQNMKRKTIGFNWGAAGVSNSLWTGVPLRELLRRFGYTAQNLESSSSENLFVCFEGPEEELPKGDKGTYGTSIPLHKALDPSQDIMIAYMQNGEKLKPDHGYPVRLIIPGYIGGRMIKWLTKITITNKESDNFYHFRDNRILPSHVDEKIADQENWWEKPEYIFNELNINSAITKPAHDEFISANYEENSNEKEYEIKGYAYTGGGRKITRCEISLNGGYDWELCEIIRPTKATKYGKHWTWVKFSKVVQISRLVDSPEVVCRAWDEANNTQPRDLTWNLMGMGNNPQFRVKTKEIAFNGKRFVKCEHPTEPGTLKGGWMGHTAGEWEPVIEQIEGQRAGDPIDPQLAYMKKQASAVVTTVESRKSSSVFSAPAVEADPRKGQNIESPKSVVPANAKYYTEEEVAKHNSEDDCWIIVKGKVYDTNAYLKEGSHPGGNASITMNAGEDTTEDFEAVHSAKAWKQLEPYYIGEVGVKPSDSSSSSSSSENALLTRSKEEEEEKETTTESIITKTKVLYPPTPTVGNVDLVKYYRENKEIYGDIVLGEEAEALAFDRMWAGASNPVDNAKNPLGCSPKKWIPLKIEKKVPLSHDCILLRLQLESPEHQVGMPVGQHLYLRGEWKGKKVMRAYTPSSLNGTLGAIEFVIKIYFSGANASYPGGGALTQFLNQLNEGDTIDVKGPVGHIVYENGGKLIIDKKLRPNNVKKMTLMGGGTGVAPMLQLIVAILSDPRDETEIVFIYANKSEKDVLLKYTLDRLEREHPARFRIHYLISNALDNSYSEDIAKGRMQVGRISQRIIALHGFDASNDGTSVAIMCGPPAFEEDTCMPALKELSFPDEDIIRY